jgi:hypothetical protein
MLKMVRNDQREERKAVKNYINMYLNRPKKLIVENSDKQGKR